MSRRFRKSKNAGACKRTRSAWSDGSILVSGTTEGGIGTVGTRGVTDLGVGAGPAVLCNGRGTAGRYGVEGIAQRRARATSQRRRIEIAGESLRVVGDVVDRAGVRVVADERAADGHDARRIDDAGAAALGGA